MKKPTYPKFLLLLAGFLIMIQSRAQDKDIPTISYQDGHFAYKSDSKGNNVPDFSYAGYQSSDKAIPFVEARVFVSWKEGDQTDRIQKAISHVASLPLQKNGFRGAVILDKGTFEIAGGLEIQASGIVLRGSGSGDDETVILGTGLDRTTMLRVHGKDDASISNEKAISYDYVSVDAMSFELIDASQFKVGDEILIRRPSTKEWVSELGMQDFGGDTGYIGWKEGERDITWNRIITRIEGKKLFIDAPITTALDKQYGGGLVSKVSWPGRIENVGIENLKLESTYDESNPKDEQHRWMAITLESVRDAWVRQVNFEHFAGSAVAIWNTANRVTVKDCKSLNPISEIGGQRRYTFYTEGQQCLFLRCYAEYGYHDFGTGFMAAGPNAFVQCQSFLPHSFSGAIDSWASGILFDIVNVNAQALRFGNRGIDAQGAGWTAANSMFWQCSASLIECPAPPTAINWAYAAWSQFSGDGYWYEANSFVKPRSLFFGQLSDRIGEDVLSRARLLPIVNEASSSPTIEEAREFVEQGREPQPQLNDWIDKAGERNPVSLDKGEALSVDGIKTKGGQSSESKPYQLALQNGKLVFGEQLVAGNRQTVRWWRGNVREYDAKRSSPHVTRYVPGRVGLGHTDDLEVTVEMLEKNNVSVLDHNYGLWYDRRRDDHERVRRMNGEAWAPFYELPFARSGLGAAYDGMSKYDLTKYNYWYWNRLSDFVQEAEEKGLVLFHQNYFQHNILEAGGHYADFPWRTANNINDTPFPEPVNYAGDKRVFMAEQFYDVSNPEYRALHQAYIKKCLDNFAGQNNVIQFTSAEYTGPLSFIEFWLDEIATWEKQTGKDAMVALSATKDVQDAILNDPLRADVVDAIDIRYWYYGISKADEMELYAPKGGLNLAPRQHARLAKTPKETFESTYKAVVEYTSNYPDKAIIHNTHRSSAFGWAVFMAGGSLMNLPKISNDQFLADAAKMKATFVKEGVYRLKDEGSGSQVYYIDGSNALDLDLTKEKGSFEVYWINSETGEVSASKSILKGGTTHRIANIKSAVLWLHKK